MTCCKCGGEADRAFGICRDLPGGFYDQERLADLCGGCARSMLGEPFRLQEEREAEEARAAQVRQDSMDALYRRLRAAKTRREYRAIAKEMREQGY